jgi:hypothetical protein
MSENTNPQPTALAEGSNTPTGPHSVGDILKNAQSEMATILELVETARTATAESQKVIAAAHTDAQIKLSEITAAATAAKESQNLAATALNEAQTKLSDITDAATQAVAAKTKISDEQAVIATKSDHIQKAQEHADKVRADLDRALTTATQQATATEGQNSRAQTSADSASALLTDIQKNKLSVETDAASIVTARKTAEESTAMIKGLADKSIKVETHIAEYEKRLAELELQCANQLKTIIDLLPGATSAGLAHAFDDRRKTFLKPHDRWQWLFVGSLMALMVVAIHGFLALYHGGPEGTASVPTLDIVLRMWLSRLPFVGALVWLALHASREAALAKRLEEDYGYKSAIASSFLGFHKQMTEVGSASESNKPLAKLCGDTLTTIANPPGRIYEKHKLTITPADPFTDAAKAAGKIITP